MVDEDALVEAARAGGTRAFARLWELLSPSVVGYVRSRGVAEPDDLTSEVFVAAFARIGDFAGDAAAFRRFLFTLAHHKAVDDVRRRFGPRARRHEPLDHLNDPRTAPSAEDEALRELYGEQVQGLLAALAPAQREVLLLRVVACLDVGEVAAVLGRSEGAIKQLQHRALSTLRRRIGDAASQPACGVTDAGAQTIARVT